MLLRVPGVEPYTISRSVNDLDENKVIPDSKYRDNPERLDDGEIFCRWVKLRRRELESRERLLSK